MCTLVKVNYKFPLNRSYVFVQGQDGSKGDKGGLGLPGNPGDPGLRGKDVSKSYMTVTAVIQVVTIQHNPNIF